MTAENRSIAGLIEYIAARAPEFPRRLRAATGAEIAALEAAVAPFVGALPAEYHDFLAAMGGGETPFPFFYDADHRVAEVTEKHRQLLEDGENPPSGSLLVAVYGYQTDEVGLECVAGEAHGKPSAGRVFVPDGDRVAEHLGDGFIEYLYNQAFKYVVGAKAAATGTLTGAETAPALERIAEAAAGFGLERRWFSDSVTLCAADAQEKTVVYARQKIDERPWVRVSGDDQKTLAALKSALERAAGLNFEKWWN